MAGKKRTEEQDADNGDLYEATAGWDSYVSELLRQAQANEEVLPRRPSNEWPAHAERRREPRDRRPSRRRALLMNEAELDPAEKRPRD